MKASHPAFLWGRRCRVRAPVPLVALMASALALGGCTPQATGRPPVVTMPQAMAPAAAAGFTCPARGTALTTSTNRTTIFHGTAPGDPDTCLVQFSTSAGPARKLFLLASGNAMQAADFRRAFRTFLPFEPGKAISIDITGIQSAQQWKITLHAIDRRTITTPAGTFEVFVIDHEEEGMGGNYYKGTERWFFRTSDWLPVRFEYTHFRGNHPGLANWEARWVGFVRL